MSIDDATQFIESGKSTNLPRETMSSIPNKPAFADVANQPRANQQQILPSAVQTRLLGNLFSNNPTSSSLGTAIKLSTNLPNANSVSFKFTFKDPQGREIIGVPDVAFYIGTPDAANQWPNPTFGMGNMPTSVFNDWGLSDNKNVVVRATIRNNTGSAQLVYCYCRLRIIVNPGLQFDSSGAGQS